MLKNPFGGAVVKGGRADEEFVAALDVGYVEIGTSDVVSLYLSEHSYAHPPRSAQNTMPTSQVTPSAGSPGSTSDSEQSKVHRPSVAQKVMPPRHLMPS